jgi:hypothetical protein
VLTTSFFSLHTPKWLLFLPQAHNVSGILRNIFFAEVQDIPNTLDTSDIVVPGVENSTLALATV